MPLMLLVRPGHLPLEGAIRVLVSRAVAAKKAVTVKMTSLVNKVDACQEQKVALVRLYPISQKSLILMPGHLLSFIRLVLVVLI